METVAPDQFLGMGRCFVTMMQFQEQKKEYETAMAENEAGTEAYAAAMQACHASGAKRAVDVVTLQRGLYVKAAQFVVSLRGAAGERGVPRAYTDALAVFTDHAPNKSAAEIAEVMRGALDVGKWPDEHLTGVPPIGGEEEENAGPTLSENKRRSGNAGAEERKRRRTDSVACADAAAEPLLAAGSEDPATAGNGRKAKVGWIENDPIASASLAQVHRARLVDGTKLAIKVQYPELQKEMASDFAAFRQMAATTQVSGYDLAWVVEDLEKNLRVELDFRREADSAEETARQLAHLAPSVFVPRVYRDMSNDKVLTMELCENLLKVTDPASLRAAGLDVGECADLLCATFSEMIFVHGRVHADPHAGNIYLRARGVSGGRVEPELVILDHGLYHDLSEGGVRRNFCRYWKACCAQDGPQMRTLGTHFAGALHRFLPLLLSPWFVFGGTGVTLREIVAASRGEVPDTVGLKDVADFIVATREGGANMIGLLHSLGYLRGLLDALEFPEERRIACMLRHARWGDADAPPPPGPDAERAASSGGVMQLASLRTKIRVLSPLARLLLRFTSAESLPGVGAACMAFGLLGVASAAAAAVARFHRQPGALVFGRRAA